MHFEHKKLLAELKKHKSEASHFDNDNYISSGHIYYNVSVPVRRQIAKEWLKAHKGISHKEFVAVLDSLYKGGSHEEKTLASILLGYHYTHRKDIGPKLLDSWLDLLVGWAEVDGLCQSNFTADELLGEWSQWKAFIVKLSKDANINKRRAALALLTGPIRSSRDTRLSELAFHVIDTLKHEKPIIITKAISWLMRDMTMQHKSAVNQYLKKNENVLPKVAVRETWRKIRTGRK